MDWLGLPVVDFYKGLYLPHLPLNHAYVIANTSIDSVAIYGVTDDCFHCPYKLEQHLKGGKEVSWEVDTSIQRSWRIFRDSYEHIASSDSKGGLLCEMRPTLGEYGVYRLDVGKCVVQPEVPPINSYLPFLLTVSVLLACFVLYKTVVYAIKRHKQRVSLRQEKVLEIIDNNSEDSCQSLYTFRGIIIVLMVFMTTGGGGYPIFNRSWAGISLAECLFFAYVWSIGVFIPKFMDEAILRPTKWTTMKTIFTRAFFLIALGFVIDSTVQYTPNRYLSSLWCPLQRLGIAYLITASTYTLTVRKFQTKSKTTICQAVGNMVSIVWCWVLFAVLLAIIIILIDTLISLNCLGDVTMYNHLEVAKKLRDFKDDTENCNNAFTEYMNKLFVADNKKVIDVDSYIGFSQGILGVMSTITYMITGIKTGVIYQNFNTHSQRLKLWGFWAMLFGLIGIVLPVISYPIDFNLWPIALILVLTSASIYAFMSIYSAVEVYDVTCSVVNTFGVTSLPVLCGHLLFSNSLPFRWGIDIRYHLLYLLQNYWIIALWFVLSFIMNKKKIRFDM